VARGEGNTKIFSHNAIRSGTGEAFARSNGITTGSPTPRKPVVIRSQRPPSTERSGRGPFSFRPSFFWPRVFGQGCFGPVWVQASCLLASIVPEGCCSRPMC